MPPLAMVSAGLFLGPSRWARPVAGSAYSIGRPATSATPRRGSRRAAPRRELPAVTGSHFSATDAQSLRRSLVSGSLLARRAGGTPGRTDPPDQPSHRQDGQHQQRSGQSGHERDRHER